jgi:lysozyme
MSQNGIDMIKSFEGLRLNAYWDRYGKVWTIGYGETKGIKAGMVWTRQQCRDSLTKRINDYTKPINRWQTRIMKPNEFDAVGCLSWNSGSVRDPLKDAINNNNAQLIRVGFLKVVYSKGKFVRGLKNRRLKELDAYFNGTYYLIPSVL